MWRVRVLQAEAFLVLRSYQPLDVCLRLNLSAVCASHVLAGCRTPCTVTEMRVSSATRTSPVASQAGRLSTFVSPRATSTFSPSRTMSPMRRPSICRMSSARLTTASWTQVFSLGMSLVFGYVLVVCRGFARICQLRIYPGSWPHRSVRRQVCKAQGCIARHWHRPRS